jgi:serine/threonine protein kinase
VGHLSFQSTEPIAGYKVLERIGAGGYGEVWRVEVPGGLVKAIKFVYGYLDEERAGRELKALNRIKAVRHPFLLSLERIEVVDGQLMIVTELADGCLKDRFDECRRNGQAGIPREELLAALRDAAEALDYMHEQFGLAHLDVKPENLLLVGGRVKVADFGLVKEIGDHSVSMMAGLTPVYAPPELFDGQPSHASDQYSLAIVYQEMLTGELPFPGRTAAQLAAQHLQSKPRLAPLSRTDQAVMAQALAKDPKARFPTCLAFIDSLKSPPGPTRPPARPPDDVTRTQPIAESNDNDQTLVGLPGPVDAAKKRPGADSAMTEVMDGTARAPQGGAIGAAPAEPSVQSARPAEVLPPIEVSETDFSLAPTLWIGIGGIAGRVLREMKRLTAARLGRPAADALCIVLIDADSEELANDGPDDPGAIESSRTVLLRLQPAQNYRSSSDDLLSWLSRRWLYNIPRTQRPEGIRPLGRLVFMDHRERVGDVLRDALRDAIDPERLAALANHAGIPVADGPAVVRIVGSINGGTASGMLLDVGPLVREAATLMQRPVRIEGVLLHATPRKSALADVAAANGHALLQELNHLVALLNEPGRAEVFAPFDSARMTWLGERLAPPDLEQAVWKASVGLFLDSLTPVGSFVRRCRESGATDRTSRNFNLEAMAIEFLDSRDDELPSLGREWLCRESAVQQLKSDGESPELQGWLEQLTPSALAAIASDLWQANLGTSVEELSRRIVVAATAETPASPSSTSRRFMTALDNCLGPRADRALPASREEKPASSPTDKVWMKFDTLARDLKDWLIRLVDSSRIGVGGAARAAESIRSQITHSREAIRSMLTRLRAELTTAESTLSQDASDAERLSIFVRLRFDERILADALNSCQALDLQSAQAADLLNQLRASLEQAAASFKVDPAFLLEFNDDGSADETERLTAGLDSPEIAEIRRRLFQEKDWLVEELWRRHSTHGRVGRTGLGAFASEEVMADHIAEALRSQAGPVVREGLRRARVLGFLQESEAQSDKTSSEQGPGGAATWLVAALPVLSRAGGGRRTLVCGPPTASDLFDLVSNRAGEPVSRLADHRVPCGLVAVAQGLSIPHVAASIVDGRPDLVTMASRLHTRVDVVWQPITVG